jgi:hypothetical protein
MPLHTQLERWELVYWLDGRVQIDDMPARARCIAKLMDQGLLRYYAGADAFCLTYPNPECRLEVQRPDSSDTAGSACLSKLSRDAAPEESCASCDDAQAERATGSASASRSTRSDVRLIGHLTSGSDRMNAKRKRVCVARGDVVHAGDFDVTLGEECSLKEAAGDDGPDVLVENFPLAAEAEQRLLASLASAAGESFDCEHCVKLGALAGDEICQCSFMCAYAHELHKPLIMFHSASQDGACLLFGSVDAATDVIVQDCAHPERLQHFLIAEVMSPACE